MRLPRIVVLLVALLLLAGCDFDVYKLPLPGGADTGENPISVKARFASVLDLVPQSTVKVADVTVGKVTDIELDGYTAVVTMELRDDVTLPDNARADIRQTSLLGEKFVSLAAPAQGGTGQLSDGDVITETGRNPEVEEVLGALSLVLNGGGVAQLKTITTELNNALQGREGDAKSLLTQFDTLMTQLDANKAGIVTAISALNRLSISVNRQQGTINLALDKLPSALTSLNSQRKDLIKMLRALNRLSNSGVRVIKASKQTTIDTLTNLTPILAKLAEAGDAFPQALNVALTYPFVDETVGRDPNVARNLHMGDYTNLSIKLDVNLDEQHGLPELPTPTLPLPSLSLPPLPVPVVNDVLDCLTSGDLTGAACQRVLAAPTQLAQLKQECAKAANKDNPVCLVVNPADGTPLDPATLLADPLGGVLPRPAPQSLAAPPSAAQPSLPSDPRGPTVGQLAATYDADLVSLYLPGVMTQ